MPRELYTHIRNIIAVHACSMEKLRGDLLLELGNGDRDWPEVVES